MIVVHSQIELCRLEAWCNLPAGAERSARGCRAAPLPGIAVLTGRKKMLPTSLIAETEHEILRSPSLAVDRKHRPLFAVTREWFDPEKSERSRDDSVSDGFP
jgi:hypothetical protein